MFCQMPITKTGRGHVEIFIFENLVPDNNEAVFQYVTFVQTTGIFKSD